MAAGPAGDRIYVTEMGGERQVKIFDRKGKSIRAFGPPHLNAGERAPVYLAIDPLGQVYVTDREQHVVYIFNREGVYLDSLIGPEQTLSEYMREQANLPNPGSKYILNLFQNLVFYQAADGAELSTNIPYYPEWSPLGVRTSPAGDLLVTDVTKEKNTVIGITLPAENGPETWVNFDPSTYSFGATGQGNGEFMFPNAAVQDSQGRLYVSDGNNRRISVWDRQGSFLYSFGDGTGETGLSLPRGLAIDENDRLYVVDAVGQNIKVYDVSKAEPAFLFAFGDFGVEDGMFNYPNDIAIDSTGRLYIVDRENNRVQVWTY